MHKVIRVMLTVVFIGLTDTSANAQTDPRFSEAIEAEENWDRDKAVALLENACEEQAVGACGRLLSLYLDGEEEEKKRDLSRKLCASGDAYACYLLGNMANWSSDIPEEKSVARSSYAKACEANLTIACNAQADMIAKGEGGTKDPAQALAIYQEACRKKYGPACFMAADAIQSSIWDGEREEAEAKQMEIEVRLLYEKACDNSHAEACLQLAKMLRQGDGGDKEPMRAMKIMKRMCATEIRACEEVVRLRFYQP